MASSSLNCLSNSYSCRAKTDMALRVRLLSGCGTKRHSDWMLSAGSAPVLSSSAPDSHRSRRFQQHLGSPSPLSPPPPPADGANTLFLKEWGLRVLAPSSHMLLSVQFNFSTVLFRLSKARGKANPAASEGPPGSPEITQLLPYTTSLTSSAS